MFHGKNSTAFSLAGLRFLYDLGVEFLKGEIMKNKEEMNNQHKSDLEHDPISKNDEIIQ